MGSLWTWLDGKKTTIGAGLLLAGMILREVFVGIWDVDWSWIPNAIETLDWFGGVVTAGGLVHKGAKMTKTTQ